MYTNELFIYLIVSLICLFVNLFIIISFAFLFCSCGCNVALLYMLCQIFSYNCKVIS